MFLKLGSQRVQSLASLCHQDATTNVTPKLID